MFEGMKELNTPGTGAPSVNEGLAAEDELFGHLGESARAVGSTHSPAFTGALATEEELFPRLSPNPALATEEELFPRLSPDPALATEEELFPRLSPDPALATEEELFPGLSPNPALATEEELFPRPSASPGALATEEELCSWELIKKTFPSTMATRIDWGELAKMEPGAALSETSGVIGLGVKEGIGNGVIDKLATEGGSLLRLPEWAETAAKVAETLKIAEL